MGGIMKKTILALVAVGVLVLVTGCDPFGSGKTMTYITGIIYTDAAMTVPAEGIAVELWVNPDSSEFISQTVFTNAAGVFFMEIQFFPGVSEEGGGTGYVLPSYGKAGLRAHWGTATYTYADNKDNPFLLSPGDTLTVWPVSLEQFGGGTR